MNIRDYVVGGLAALALGGCAKTGELKLTIPLGKAKEITTISYGIQPNGLRVPLFPWGKIKPETTMYGFSVYEKRTLDLDKDKSIDFAEITFFESAADYNDRPAGRILLEDANKDGNVDIIYTDMTKEKFMPGADGMYESATTASQLFLEVYGMPPTKRLLKMENFLRLMVPNKKETIEEFILGGEKI